MTGRSSPWRSSRTGWGSREDKSAENEQRDAPLGASRVFFVSAMQILQGTHALRLPILGLRLRLIGPGVDAAEFVDIGVFYRIVLEAQQQKTRATSEIYEDLIFDTSPVAGKVYKSRESRRKQGVSCGFLCTYHYIRSHQQPSKMWLALIRELLSSGLKE